MSDSDSPRAERQMTAPHAIAVAGEDWSTANVADPQRTAWRAELAALGGRRSSTSTTTPRPASS